MRESVVAFLLPFFLLASQQTQQPSGGVPDAPAPQSTTVPGVRSTITPGAGTAAEQQGVNQPGGANTPAPGANQVPASEKAPQAPVADSTDNSGDLPPEMLPAPGQGPTYKIRTNVNYVQVPVTVKDKNHQLVAGLTWRDFRIYENNARQRLSFFSVDPFPLSVALVIDQGLPQDTMAKVNDALLALPGAFTPADEVAVFTYATSPHMQTDFTGAQSARLPAVLEQAKQSGREMGVPVNSGPLAEGPMVNGHPAFNDPNLNPVRSGGSLGVIPKETHTLSDAILAAAEHLQGRPDNHRRIIYVISDGKDAGSKAKYDEVVKYLLGHQISVYGTVVGDSAVWGLGFLDRVKIPLIGPQNNILPKYAAATAGALDAELSRNGIENSFGKITEQVRSQYTLGYYSQLSTLNDRYRTLEVKVLRPNLDVEAPAGYYPSAKRQQQP